MADILRASTTTKPLRGTRTMTKRSAATVQTPGASTTTKPKTAKPASNGPNVAEAAIAKRAKGPVDPTKLKQPVFVEGEGWVCPATPEQITAAEAEAEEVEEVGEEPEDEA